MFDSSLRPLIDPPLNRLGKALARTGMTANHLTVGGFLVGMLAFPAIAVGQPLLGLLFIALNRLADGLDGAVARATQLSDRGGYLDIVLDFVFYASVPLAFAVANPAGNALAAAVLLFAFMGTGSSFLAFAIMAAKHDLETDHQGKKSLYYLQGLAEGAETIAFMVLCCLFPAKFALFAYLYSAICFLTTASRIWVSYRLIKSAEEAKPR